MRAYSMDLRERVLHDSDAGMQAAAVASKYRVSASWVRRLKHRRRETGEVAPRQQRYGRHPVLASQLHTLAALIREQPDRTLADLQVALGTSASLAKAPPVFLDTDLGENPMSKEVGKMVRSRDVVQAEGSARTEGARRATGVRADGAAAGAGSLAPGQRWSASRKRDVVLRLLRGESLEALSREAGVEIYRLDAWRERAMAGLELGLKDRHGEPVAEVLDAAKRHIGELSMEIELLRERARAAEQRLPLAMRRSRR